MYLNISNKQIYRKSQGDDVLDDDAKRLEKGKRIVIDKQTGKKKEVDIYDRSENTKKKDPEKLKAIFSSTLE